jgi:hypothetical protein
MGIPSGGEVTTVLVTGTEKNKKNHLTVAMYMCSPTSPEPVVQLIIFSDLFIRSTSENIVGVVPEPNMLSSNP